MTKTTTHVICKQETNIALLKQNQEYQTKMIEEMHHKILGNGKPGLIDEVSGLKNSIKPLEDITVKVNDMERKMWYFAGSVAVITALITLLAPRIVTTLIG